MFTPTTRSVHAEQEGAQAVLELMRRLRAALSEGRPTVEVPTGLAGASPPRQPAAKVRAELARRVDALVRERCIDSEQARVLRRRFALDGMLRSAGEVAGELDIGRETMRTRYLAAAGHLADHFAEMPLVLRPEVELTRAELELRVAFGLLVHRSRDFAERDYVDARVRHRLLGHDRPPAPGRGRPEDRRWQRAADRIAGSVETALTDDHPVPLLTALKDETLVAIRHWLDAGGQPTSQTFAKDFDLAVLFLSAIANGQGPELLPAITRALERAGPQEGDPLGLAVGHALQDRGPLTVASFILTVREARPEDPEVRVVAKLIEQHLADDLARAGYVDAGEHLMRLAADSSDAIRGGWHPDHASHLVASFATDRFLTRAALHLARGPDALEELRASLLAAAEFSTRVPGGVEYAHACRLKLLAINGEIAAHIAGEALEPGREHFRKFSQTLVHSPTESLSPTIDAAMRDYPRMLEGVWSGTSGFDRDRLEQALVEGIATLGPGTRMLVRRWTRPR
jgi:hypothetical protein